MGVFVVLILACGGIAFLITRVASSAVGSLSNFTVYDVKTFYDDLNTSDYAGARGLLTDNMKSQYSAATLQSQWETFSQSSNVTVGLPDVGQLGGDSTSTTAHITLTNNGKDYPLSVNMVKSGSLWLINGASPGLIPSP